MLEEHAHLFPIYQNHNESATTDLEREIAFQHVEEAYYADGVLTDRQFETLRLLYNVLCRGAVVEQ